MRASRNGPLDRDRNPRVFRGLERDLRRTFPLLKGVRIEHRRGGPVSVPLDFFPAMAYLGRDKRVAYSLGCVGHGVALNMAGQIMRDLVLGQESEFTSLFFVNRGVTPQAHEPIILEVCRHSHLYPCHGLNCSAILPAQ